MAAVMLVAENIWSVLLVVVAVCGVALPVWYSLDSERERLERERAGEESTQLESDQLALPRSARFGGRIGDRTSGHTFFDVCPRRKGRPE
ncbi:hypothetical protein KQH82_06275 [bacterium]|nr:hypothetical protein [bacterium]